MQISSTTGTEAATAAQRQTLASDFSGFLKLLTAQLQNQDPLAPMDADKFTSQLVQFSGVEQALATNAKLDRLSSIIDGAARASTLGYLGTSVEIEGGMIGPEPGRSSFTYVLGREAQEVEVRIFDPSGRLALKEVGGLAQGENRYTWNGRLADGRAAEPGTYRVEVQAADASGRAVPVTMRSTGVVERVALDGAAPALVIAGAAVPLASIRGVAKPGL